MPTAPQSFPALWSSYGLGLETLGSELSGSPVWRCPRREFEQGKSGWAHLSRGLLWRGVEGHAWEGRASSTALYW